MLSTQTGRTDFIMEMKGKTYVLALDNAFSLHFLVQVYKPSVTSDFHQSHHICERNVLACLHMPK